MSLVIVREYADIGATYGGKVVQAPAEPKIVDQAITSSATTAPSAAFNANTRMVGISTANAQAVAIEFSATPGATPTAVIGTSLRLPANGLYFFVVRQGDKLAVIDVA